MNIYNRTQGLTEKPKKKRVVKSEDDTTTHLKWNIQEELKTIKELEAQDETGWSELDISIKGKVVNIPLCRNHIFYYQKIIDSRREPYKEHLNYWKDYIIGLCKEHNQEVDIIWFDDDSVYDSNIHIRMKGHKCWNDCVEFRFKDKVLHAYDSEFGHGTTFIDHLYQTHEDRLRIIKELMEKVFNRECEKRYVEFWKKEDYENCKNRYIEVDDKGWFKITEFGHEEKTLSEPETKVNKVKIQQLSVFEEKAQEEFNKVLDKIANDKTTSVLEDIYRIPMLYTKMVVLGDLKGFLLYGEGGLGKTHLIIKTFKENNKPFVILSGHITPMELFCYLFEHRTETIVLDDCNILDNEKNLNLLKACLSDNSRVVQYHTSSNKLRVPDKFLFEGKIIMLMNSVPLKSDSLKAVESRILHHKLELDYETKIQVIYEIAKQPYKQLSLEERQFIAKWLHENTSKATENLNIRLLFMCYEFYLFDKPNWINLANSYIKTDWITELIVHGITNTEWVEETGLSVRTLQRKKKELATKRHVVTIS